MHAQQGQMFGAQQAYSQQLSASMPQFYQGLGAQGFQGGFGQGPGYGYSYAGQGGYGPGNSFGNAMTSAVGGFGHAVGAAAPFAGGIAGAMMGGIGGAMTGWGIGGMVGGAVSHVANSFMTGAHEQASIERTLSQFQFSNSQSRTGRGFTRQDSMAIGNMVRQMERIPEMLTSFGELNKLMDKMGQMGLMQGVRDAGEFMNKFQKTVGTLKDLAKVMGTTMEGALKAFGESRLSGFYSQGDIVKNVMNRQLTGSLTGMNQMQVGALQQYGSQIGHATGGSRASGARLALRTAGQLGMMNQMGILSNDEIVEMTGKEGAEGIQDLSGQMTELSYRMSKSNVGQALTLALGEQKDGRYTGRMDQALVDKVRKGELSLGELKSMARRKAGTRGAKLSFAAHSERLRSEMAGATGAEGQALMLQEILGERGWQNPDAVNLVMQRFGMNEEQANLMQQMMPNLQGMGSQMAIEAKSQGRRSAMNAVRSEHGWDAIKHRIGKKISKYTTDWAKDLGSSVRDYFQNWADDFLDDLSGQYSTVLTQRVSNEIISGKMSISGGSRFMKGVGGSDLSVGQSGGLSGIAARGMHFLSGDESKGERIEHLMRLTGNSGLLQSGQSGSLTRFAMGNAGLLLGSGIGKGRIKTSRGLIGSDTEINASDLSNVQAQLSDESGYGQSALKKLKGALSDDEMKTLSERYRGLMVGGSISGESDQVKRAEMIAAGLVGKANAVQIGGQYAAPSFSIGPNMNYEEAAKNADLAHKLRASGVSAVELAAALGQNSNLKYRGALSTAGLAGDLGVDASNPREVAKKRTQIINEMTKKLSKSGIAFAEFQKMLDSGEGLGDMMRLVAQKDRDVQDALAVGAENWTSEIKDKLRAKGIDPDKVQGKLMGSEGNALADRMLKAGGLITAEQIAAYDISTGITGRQTFAQRVVERGNDLSVALGSKDNQELINRLMKDKTGKGKAALEALKKMAKGFQGTHVNAATGGIEGFSDNSSDLVASLDGLGKSEREAVLQLGGPELQAMYSNRQGMQKAYGRKGSKLSIDDLLKAGHFNATDDQKKDIEKSFEGGKTKGIDNKQELEAAIKAIMDMESRGLMGKAGADVKSDAASESEIAASLKTFSENGKQMAAILSGIASGKGVADSLSELNGGGKK